MKTVEMLVIVARFGRGENRQRAKDVLRKRGTRKRKKALRRYWRWRLRAFTQHTWDAELAITLIVPAMFQIREQLP